MSFPKDRREHPRFKVYAPIEFRPEGGAVPIRGKTSNLSLGGCYVEMMFTFAIGTKVEMSLQVGDRAIRVMAIVVTRHLQFGNGVKFVDMLPKDRYALRSYLDAAEKAQTKPPASGPTAD